MKYSVEEEILVPTPKLAHVVRNRSLALQDNQSEPLTQSLH
jgi:hypothetical protein